MHRRSRLAAVVAAIALLAAAGCGDDDDGGAGAGAGSYIELDGSPREPDDEGVLVGVADDFSTLTLDGDRTFDVVDDLQAFATQDGAAVPLLQRVGTYVQLGLRDDTVVWLASIADVVDLPDRDVVYYVGDVVDLDDGRLVFEDGTVLRVADSLDLPPPPDGGARITVTIDPAQRAVVAVEPA